MGGAPLSVIALKAQGVRYWSQNDEAAFFEWLAKVRCVVGREGRGETLYISVDPDKVDEEGLRELLGLFSRYGIDLKQLEAFDTPRFAVWFRDPAAYWHAQIFAETSN